MLIAPKGSNECKILLANAVGEQQKEGIGKESLVVGYFYFFTTENFDRHCQNLLENNIKIIRDPNVEDYSKVCVFEDLYGNLWGLIQYF